MKNYKYEYVESIKDFHLLLNFIIVIFNASIFLSATNYICSHGYERAFLERVSSVPISPEKTFIESIVLGLFIIILIKMEYFRNIKQEKSWLFYFELIIAVIIIFRLNGSYNGIILVILADIIYHTPSVKYRIYSCALFSIIFIITDFNLLSNFIALPALETYIGYLPATQTAVILFDLCRCDAFCHGRYLPSLLRNKQPEIRRSEPDGSGVPAD